MSFCWLVAAVAAVVAVPLGLTTIDLTGAATQQPGLGAVLLVVHGAWITAALLGGLALTERSPSPIVLPRIAQAATALVGVAAAVVPVAGLVWFAGWGGDELQSDPESGIPVYMSQQAEVAPEYGILVIRGSVANGLTYEVERGDGPTIGEDEIAALTAEDEDATALVGDLATAPAPEAVAALTERGIRFIVQPAPADAEVATARRHQRVGARECRGPRHPRLAGGGQAGARIGRGTPCRGPGSCSSSSRRSPSRSWPCSCLPTMRRSRR